MIRVSYITMTAFILISSPVFAGSDFAGKWVNPDGKTRGIKRFEISEKDKKWTIQSWGASGDGEIDQGKTTLNLLGDSVSDTEMKFGMATWDRTFADTHVTLRMEKDELVVEEYVLFKGSSGRSNYRSKYAFKKSK